jgi:nicotinamide phosphoribosyltransferase
MNDYNLILGADSYKYSHGGRFGQYPPGATHLMGYMESRGGLYDQTLFFGLQGWLKKYLTKPVTMAEVDEAEAIIHAHGLPFNREDWEYIVHNWQGYIPVRIKAVKEGALIPTRNVLLTMESTDEKLPWLAGFLETQILRAVWYPTTVATQSYYMKQTIYKALVESADDPDGEIGFKLHDFGQRSTTSAESAGIASSAHLVNFFGSDTVEALTYARKYYHCDMAGFSIPASEHSTMTAWGREHEVDAYRNMVKQFGGEGKLYACVSDSYDIFNAVRNIWCDTLLEEVKKAGGTLVIRLDSGDPVEVILKCLAILENKVGMHKNTKGYKVLPSYFRLLQGDGIDHESLQTILEAVMQQGYSASNINFGCGGALVQKINRDTQKFAYKICSITVNGKQRDVYKDPITDHGKKSFSGPMSLIYRDGDYHTLRGANQPGDLLETVYENGQLKRDMTLDKIRAIANDQVF